MGLYFAKITIAPKYYVTLLALYWPVFYHKNDVFFRETP